MEPDGQAFLDRLEAEYNSEGDKFYAALGRAITAWNHVEGQLYELFLLCMGLPDEATASVAYHAVVNFNARWKMVGESFALRYRGTEFITDWPALHERIRKKSDQRNKLAHFVVGSEFRGKPGRKFFLIPTLSNVGNHPAVSGKPLHRTWTSDLAALEEDFKALGQEMQRLKLRIHHAQRTGPFSESFRPKPSQPDDLGAQ